jgi:beta-phosphoglucomutase-like phosphatase (HAD superfamily)
VITGDSVDRGKPHPEPYLAAARALDVLASDCLAIEDSDIGATSAAAAGCTVLVSPLHAPVPPGPGRVFVGSLEGLDASSRWNVVGVVQSLPDRDLSRGVVDGPTPRQPLGSRD